MERLTYVTEDGEILFHPDDLTDDEGMTITQLAEDGRFDALETIAERLANRESMEEMGLLVRKSVVRGWIPVSERLPEDYVPVNITWVNHNPDPYYASIKDVPFTATGICYKGKWYWYSVVCEDYLKEDEIEITAWMPLPEPYRESEVSNGKVL